MQVFGSGISRRVFLSGLAAGVALPVQARAPEVSLRPMARPAGRAATIPAAAPAAVAADVEALVARARLGGQVSFVVADARSGEMLEARAPELAQPPASVIKAVTALYGLEALGAQHRFNTRLVASAPIGGDGWLDGDLVLVGGGDPTLDTDGLGEMVAELAALGLRGVRGRFRVYSGVLPHVPMIDPDQPEYAGYNPSVGGMNLNYNRVLFEWRREGNGYGLAMEARGQRFSPAVEMARMQLSDRGAPVYTYSDRDGRDNWSVARSALGNGGSRWLPVRNPALYAGEVFRSLAGLRGIRLPAPDVQSRGRVEGHVLLARNSPPLPDILRSMLRFSTNLTAEVVGMSAASAGAGGPRDLAASARQMRDWASQRLGLQGAHFVDHSGLGVAARISAAELAQVFLRAGVDGPLRGLLRAHPMRDGRGNEMPGHPVRVAAKTGTLFFASALGGYITAPGGREMVFAILSADLERRDRITQAERDRPPGAREWTGRARTLQQQLIERWATVYG